jgi:anaerobic magnesium-protoporphyrin IX monomethyl ester cyclase
MNILCIYSITDYVDIKKPLPDPVTIPFGIATIATCLKKAGHSVELLVFTPATPVQKTLEAAIKRCHPDLVCLTSVSSQISIITQVGESLKEIDPSLFVILGGHHATLNPEEAIAYDWVDAICIGEGEGAIVELARQLEENQEPAGIPNLWIKKSNAGEVERNDTRPFLSNLDELPVIDRQMWIPWIAGRLNKHAILVGRGCPFKCTYCSNHALARIAKGSYVRMRSPQNIVGEIEQLAAEFPLLDEVYLEVESLGASLSYLNDLLEALTALNEKLPKPLIFGTNLAITGKICGNTDLLAHFQRANFKYINIGLESGSEEIRKNVLRRPSYRNADIKEFTELAKLYGIGIRMYVLIGLPGETYENFQETLDLVRECQPDNVLLSIFYPYPGTRLYDLSIEQGLLDSTFTMDIRERHISVLNLPGFSRRQIRREFILFPFKVYRGHLPWMVVMARTARGLITAYPALHSLYRKVVDRSGWLSSLRNKVS